MKKAIFLSIVVTLNRMIADLARKAREALRAQYLHIEELQAGESDEGEGWMAHPDVS